MNYKTKIFEVISQASQELNVDSYVIGGFVRDLLLKRDFKDIDIVAVGRNRIGFTRFKTTSNKPKFKF
jgi:tRNA nucleotidyltransferase (CCA-adding enzyme)